MAELTVAEFKAKKPEFLGVDDPLVQEEIDFVSLIVCEATWGRFCERAFCLMVAHYLLINPNPATSPDTPEGAALIAGVEVATDTVGDTSTSFDTSKLASFVNQNSGAATKELSMTSYGRQYLALRKRLGLSPRTTSPLNRIPPTRNGQGYY